MSEDNTTQNSNKLPDLSQLSEIKFETAWTPVSNGFTPSDKRDSSFKRKKFADKPRENGKFFDKRKRENSPRDSFRKDKPRFDSPRPRRDNQDSNTEEDKKQGFKKFPRGQKRFEKFAPFKASMEVLFYPDDAPFNKLIDAMKESKRTYQLFDIAHLVLGKFDRCVILAKNLPDADGNVKPLFCAQPMNIPFDDEQQARQVAIDWQIKNIFTTEDVECEAPKGNFQVVNRCTITNELLGAPNWHRYNEFLREYHSRKCPKMSFESFTESIESVRDAEQIEQWLNQMKTRTVYKLKEAAEGEQDTFDTLEAAANYIVHKMGDELVKSYEQVRLKGANMELLPRGRIRRNIEEEWHKQKKFPIVTANNLRGRLRRSGLTVYKRGSKGFAFVSAIKRKFLIEGEKLSELPQNIFDFITSNAGITVEKLPYMLMGLPCPEKKATVKVEVKEQLESSPIEAGEQTCEIKTSAAESDENKSASSETTADAQTAVNAELTAEQTAKFNSILSELSWLISEGYVVEYANSSLQANPYMPKPKDKSEAGEESVAAEKDEPIQSPKAEEAKEESDESTSAEESADDEKVETTQAESESCPLTSQKCDLDEEQK